MQGLLSPHAAALEQRIRQRRDMGPIVLQDDMIFPAYDGLSIVNTAQTVLDLLGDASAAPHALDASVWNGEAVKGETERVVIFLSDSVSYLLLRDYAGDDQRAAGHIDAITEGRGFSPLSSIAPSTTVAALNSYWTGIPAGEHGVSATALYLPEYGDAVNMLFASTLVGRRRVEVNPDTFMIVPSLAQRLSALDAETHVVMGNTLVDEPLSRLLYRGVRHYHAYQTMRDLSTTVWHQLEETLKITRGRRCFVFVYLPTVDTMCHMHGATSSGAKAEIGYQLGHLRHILERARQSDTMRDGKTLFIITSDHGHIDVQRNVRLHPNIRAAMRTRALSGDLRMAVLHLLPDTLEAVKRALDEHHHKDLFYIETDAALKAGLMGSGTLHPNIRERMGDLLLFAYDGVIFEDPLIVLDVKGMHTGLHEAEMLVPFMYTRF